jgi:hypothetical protein
VRVTGVELELLSLLAAALSTSLLLRRGQWSPSPRRSSMARTTPRI